MKLAVKIHYNEDVETIFVEKGETPFQAIRQKLPTFGHACNGKGTCGKCRVHLSPECMSHVSLPTTAEVKLLGRDSLVEGHRLACQMAIEEETELTVDIRERKAKITASIDFPLPKAMPAITKTSLYVPSPSLEDQRSDWERLNATAFIPGCEDIAKIVRRLPQVLREAGGFVTLVSHKGKLMGLQAGNKEASLFGISCDIGTTTIAACLVNLMTGTIVDVDVLLNGQKRYGTDVIARIQHTMDEQNGMADLHGAVVENLRTLAFNLCDRAGLTMMDIDEWVFTGNTTMGHLLMQWPAAAIAAAPFIPASVGLTMILADTLDLSENTHAVATLLPGVSAYVGADTVSAVLSCNMHQDERNTLVVDLGTNGELVLSTPKGMIACSTAAGPAFEGAGIRFGMGAVDGAIDKIFVGTDNQDICLSVLGGQKPMGLCGTGLLDAIAVLVNLGIIDETGRLQDAENLETEVSQAILARITKLDGQPAFILVYAKETEQKQDILLTQKDIREFQNAKAAISAGIATLADVAGIALSDVDEVYLAGGLGTWMNPDSAIATGLIPAPLTGKITPVGNAALVGATQCLISTDVRDQAEKIAADMSFVELSGRKDFNDRYVDAMMFGDDW